MYLGSMKARDFISRNFSIVLMCLYFMGAVILLSMEHERGNPKVLIPAFLLTAFGTILFFRHAKNLTLTLGLVLGLAFRLYTFTTVPQLSNDYVRFIWDGDLQVSGIPRVYEKTPEEIMNTNFSLSARSVVLYEDMNSQQYYSVYPPFNQLFFRLVSLTDNPFTTFGLFMLAGDLAVLLLLLRLLKRWKMSPEFAFLYFLHPMTIIEHSGNYHFEGIMWAFLLAAILMMEKEKWNTAGVLLGLAFGIKVVPLMVLPLLPAWIGWKHSIRVGLISGLVFFGSFFFMMDAGDIPHFLSSVQLYFNSFEFNASLYYFINWIGSSLAGFNTIAYVAPFLQLLVLSFVLYLAFRKKNISAQTFMLHVTLLFLVYYLCASTVHPWYLMSVFIPSLLLGFRFGAAWLTLSMLSYFFYFFFGTGTILTMILCLEYFLLALFIWQEKQAIREHW